MSGLTLRVRVVDSYGTSAEIPRAARILLAEPEQSVDTRGDLSNPLA
jgi:hypothetical protein